ncbi:MULTISPECIES: SAV_915 family protein [Streptomyces]|uniref:SAV_915 family protein n=1 Tax=Streptomyces pratisoli TaxID=3139917 RepID=A0ACC6QQJ5_9ACTN|nr:SAV_915 family protein [Streptomyces sp. NBC_00259]
MDNLVIDEADPDEPRPAGPLFVPVRLGSAGGHQLRFMRTPLGVRTAVGFTSERRLTAVLGSTQTWIRLAEPALRALSEPLGVTAVTVDPQLTAPAPAAPRPTPAEPSCSRRPAWDPEAVGVLRVTGAAAAMYTAVAAIHGILS